jgi:phosphoenolpyruvate carboxylase
VLEHHRRLYLLLVQRESARWTPAEQGHIRDEIKGLLELLRQTGELFLEKPDVASERRNVVHYLRNVFPSVVPLVDQRLADAWLHVQGGRAALSRAGRAADADARHVGRRRSRRAPARDRRGHCADARRAARRGARAARPRARRARGAAQRLGAPRAQRRERPLARALGARLAARRHAGCALARAGAARAALDRNPDEPLRQLVSGMRALLPVERHDAAREPVLGYREPSELDADLALAERALVELGAPTLAQTRVRPVRRVLATVGFHLAALDVRQNSALHERAVEQLLAAAGASDANYPSWSEPERLAMLERELATARPLRARGRAARPRCLGRHRRAPRARAAREAPRRGGASARSW